MKTFAFFIFLVTLLVFDDVESQFLGFATQNQINNLQNQINAKSAQISALQDELADVVGQGAVPAGFIYFQLSFQSPPTVIFPRYSWTDVTSDYAGYFFRAAGGDAGAINTTQPYSAPKITTMITANTAGFPAPAWLSSVPIVNGQSSNLFVSTGAYLPPPGGDAALRTDGFAVAAEGYGMENRPVNQAIIIWKRN